MGNRSHAALLSCLFSAIVRQCVTYVLTLALFSQGDLFLQRRGPQDP